MKGFLIALITQLSVFTVYADQIRFSENLGQWDSSILFKANIPGGFMVIKDNSIEYLFYDTKTLSSVHGSPANSADVIPVSHVMLTFQNANTGNKIESSGASSNTMNYFLGNDPEFWTTNVRSFAEIKIKNLYDKIDFRVYTIQGKLKYEYIVFPGGDPSTIQFTYSGTKSITATKDELLVETDVNVFKEFNPFTYQEIAGKSVNITAHFVKKNNSISFGLSPYDRSKKLIIDPELVFSTYSGSFSDNWAHTATYDSDGNLYAGGSVFGESFFVSQSAFQQVIGGASRSGGSVLTTDIVIQKYSADGSQLLYSTFLGGTGSEVPHSMITNSKGDLVIFGTTSSENFPVTITAFDKTFNGGNGIAGNSITSNITYRAGSDIFVSVISPLGDSLKGSTYVGGSGNDGINDTRTLSIRNYGDEFRGEVVVDSSGNIYVASVSCSSNFPVTENSSVTASGDAVVFRLSPLCEQLVWSSAIGGSSYDAAFSLKVATSGEVFVCGVTASDSLKLSNGFNRNLSGTSDGFVAKFNKNGQIVIFSYIGTDKADLTLLLDLGPDGNIYLLGLSNGEYPVTPGVYRNANSGQFIQVLDPELERSVLSTVFGSGRGLGIIDIVPTAFLVNNCGNMYISGWGGKVNINTNLNINSSTSGLPTTRNAFRRVTTGSNYYFTIIEAQARSLLYGSFFGSNAPPNAENERGDHLDGGTCRFDRKGIIYHAACVCKADDFVSFPLKNATSASHNSSNCNLAAFKFEIDALVADFNYADENEKSEQTYCNNTKLSFENKSSNAKTYEWFINDTLVSRQNEPNYTFRKPGTYDIKLVAYNSTLCIKSDSLVKSVNVIEFSPKAITDTAICPDAEITMFASGGERYNWSSNVGSKNKNLSTFTLRPAATNLYQVEISKGVCKVTLPVNVEVTNEKSDFTVTQGREICLGDSLLLSISGEFESFKWQYRNIVDSVNKQILVSPSETTVYNVSSVYRDGCKPAKTITLSVDKSYLPTFTTSYTPVCNRKSVLTFKNNTSNAASFIWELGNGKIFNDTVPPDDIYDNPGTYQIKLLATNATGCSLSISQEFEYNPWDGQIPNIITPNGDGKNDVLTIGTLASLRIYTRWGKLIYSREKYMNDWGSEVKSGTYFYELILPDKSTCKGYIDVIN